MSISGHAPGLGLVFACERGHTAPVRPTVFLFDVDGTLVDTGGAGRRAIERAFALRHGRGDACAALKFGGMTDRAIVRAGLAAIGQMADDAGIDALLATYVAMLEDEVARSERYRVLAGVERVLDACASREAVAVGLGTGNVRVGAKVKLERAGLFDRFAFGGFGCDAEDRGQLLAVGAARGAAALGVDLPSCRVVVVGDTPKDVAAAKAIGAECFAVATGPFTCAELEACEPTAVFSTLNEDGAAAAIVG